MRLYIHLPGEVASLGPVIHKKLNNYHIISSSHILKVGCDGSLVAGGLSPSGGRVVGVGLVPSGGRVVVIDGGGSSNSSLTS